MTSGPDGTGSLAPRGKATPGRARHSFTVPPSRSVSAMAMI